MLNFREYINENEVGELLFILKEDDTITEAAEASRYSIEINYRTTPDETLEAFAKLALGYVSAGLKQHDFHVKHVYTEKPIRILVSSRNWDDGEWVVLVSWNPQHKCFIVSKGFYNKDRKTVSIQSSQKCTGESAAEITKQVYNMMHSLKGQKDRHLEKLKPVPLKRGPKS